MSSVGLWKVANLVLDLVAAGAEREMVIAQVREKELAGFTSHEISLWLAQERDRAIAAILEPVEPPILGAGVADGEAGMEEMG